MPDLTDYSYRVVWSAEDGEYVAAVPTLGAGSGEV